MYKNFYQSSVWARYIAILLILPFVFASCDSDDDVDDGSGTNDLTGNLEIYNLDERNDSGVSGTVTFAEATNGSTVITIDLTGTSDGNSHPAHIHMNTAAEGGDIVVSLTDVDGDDGESVTVVAQTDAGNSLSYNDLITYDGYVNVHLSSSDLMVVAQGDIGENALTGVSESYQLDERNSSGVSGVVTFYARQDGTTLAEIDVDGTPVDGDHPAHIHANTAAEGGPIVISFNNVDGGTGMSYTNIEAFDDGTSVTYNELIQYNGYVNVHLSSSDLTVVSQTDIGGNAFTGNSTVYNLDERNSSGVSGTATFYERNNGNTQVVLDVQGTPADGDHPAHIHANSAAEGGAIVMSLTNVDGSTGMSTTEISETDDGNAISYSELINYDGYINVHLSSGDLTVVAQGDVGSNALTGESIVYDFTALNSSGVTGTATLSERKDGTALLELNMTGTPADGDHPAHIHANSAAEGGPIVISLTNVEGSTGLSRTSIDSFNDGAPVTYADLLSYDGYINVHLSASDLTVVSQTDIGSNDN
ncbi:MAG: CHRD domain-containing protein [Cyclobacteriaceae bacterium]